MKNHNEAISGTDAFKIFATEFGPNDVYTRIILEVLLEELMRPTKLVDQKEKYEDK